MIRRSFLAALACFPWLRWPSTVVPSVGQSDRELEREIIDFIFERRLARDFAVKVDGDEVRVWVSSYDEYAVNGVLQGGKKGAKGKAIFVGLEEWLIENAIPAQPIGLERAMIEVGYETDPDGNKWKLYKPGFPRTYYHVTGDRVK